jgi:hypothetical protein
MYCGVPIARQTQSCGLGGAHLFELGNAKVKHLGDLGKGTALHMLWQ